MSTPVLNIKGFRPEMLIKATEPIFKGKKHEYHYINPPKIEIWDRVAKGEGRAAMHAVWHGGVGTSSIVR